jgi:NAD(P)-dependent dehydrogenase (short-subunit alcohol dehydrogenase family)
VSLRALPLPDHLECTLPPDHSAWITDDGTGLSARLAQALAARGWRAHVLPPLRDEALDTQLDAFRQDHGPVGALIHVHPHAEADAALGEPALARVRQVFLLARHLQPALTAAAGQAGPGERVSFVTVTRMDGALGLEGATALDPLDGGLAGLTKTLALEWPDVFCRAVDLAPDLPPERAVAAILAELHDPDRRRVEVGWRDQGRVTLATTPQDRRDTP